MDQYQFGAFTGYAAAMDADAAEALKTMAGVTGVEPNRKVASRIACAAASLFLTSLIPHRCTPLNHALRRKKPSGVWCSQPSTCRSLRLAQPAGITCTNPCRCRSGQPRPTSSSTACTKARPLALLDLPILWVECSAACAATLTPRRGTAMLTCMSSTQGSTLHTRTSMAR
jgi:hypothetical protein